MKTIRIPTEAIVSFNKNGITNIEVVNEVQIELNQQSVEALLLLLGTTPEKVFEAILDSNNSENNYSSL